MKAFVLSVIGLGCIAIAAAIGLPYLRSQNWKETVMTTQGDSVVVDDQEVSEDDITAEMSVDTSVYDRKADIRKIQAVPDTTVALEAAFRQRKSDACEPLGDGEPLDMSQFTSTLTSRDRYKSKDSLLPTTRREIMTIGLNMLPLDQRQLPALSRSTITDFLENHYLSLQARIIKDPKTLKWSLHYRPIAAIGKLRGVPYSQKWEEAVASTVQDIRGLGIWEDNSNDTSQTAVIVFRSDWLDDDGVKAGARHELAFIHAEEAKPEKSSSRDLLKLHIISTSNLRTIWNHFIHTSQKKPKSQGECDIVGTVRFDEFSKGGLSPKSVVTRKMKANTPNRYHVAEINAYLEEQQLQGGWSKNLRQAIQAVLKDEIPVYHEQ